MRYYCTYFDSNYLIKGLALIRSLQAHEKRPFRLFVVCHDELSRVLLNRLALPGVETVPMHALEQGDAALLGAKRTRSRVEYYWTTTPTVILRLLERHPEIDVLTYLDSDLFFFSSPDAIYEALGARSILIHEHRYSPDLAHLEAEGGRFNVGLLAFRNDESGLGALSWWRDRCIEWCYHRVEDGKMGDQMYLNDWPTRFPNVAVLAHVGAGTAPWNQAQYRFAVDPAGGVTVDGAPLVFYHFHALEVMHPGLVIPSRHTAYRLSADVLRLVYRPYLDVLHEAVGEVQALLPGFSAGIRQPNLLTPAHTVLVHAALAADVQELEASHTPAALDGTWTCYTPQRAPLKAAAPLNVSADRSPAAAQPSLPTIPSPQAHEITEEYLLHWLEAYPVRHEVRSLWIVGAHLFQERALLDRLFPNLEHIYLFEPLPPVYEYLEELAQADPRLHVFPYAVGDRDGTAPMYVTDNRGASSSLLPLGKHKEIFPHVHVSATIEVPVRRLETVLREHRLSAPDMLLLDVQGAEYAILSTLPAAFREQVKLIYTEVSKEELYVGAKNLDDVDEALRNSFHLLGFAPLTAQSPTHGNALFIHRNQLHHMQPAARPAPSSTRQPDAGPYRVTAIVSTYNSEAFIRGCLEDLVGQTLFERGELEIVVVDACSPQNERAIIEEFQRQYDHIVYVRPARREGLYTSWNRAIRVAQGRYITNANTDDRHRPDALERLADYLDGHPDVALAFADQLITKVPNETWATTEAELRLNPPPYTYEELERHCTIGAQPMWRKAVHDRYGYFREDFKSAGDYEFWLRIGRHEQFYRYPDILGLYLFNPNGIQYSSDAGYREHHQILHEYRIPERGITELPTIRARVTREELDSLPYRNGRQPAPSGRSFSELVEDYSRHAQRQDWAGAQHCARQCTQAFPNESYGWVLLSMALRMQGDLVQAMKAVTGALAVEESPEALFEILQISSASGDTAEGRQIAQYLQQRFPEWMQRTLAALAQAA